MTFFLMHRYCSLAALSFFASKINDLSKQSRIHPSRTPPRQKAARRPMNDPRNSPIRGAAAWLRRSTLWVLFALVLLIPKVNRLRRRRALWNSVRMLIAVAGVSVLVVGVTRGIHAGAFVAAGIMLLFALLAIPERQGISLDVRRRELGALVVVDGGLYSNAAGTPERVKLFVASDRLFVVDGELHVVHELPYEQIRAQSVESSGDGWSFQLESEDRKREFLYQGVFAEHFARVAAATIRSRLHRELPVLH